MNKKIFHFKNSLFLSGVVMEQGQSAHKTATERQTDNDTHIAQSSRQ